MTQFKAFTVAIYSTKGQRAIFLTLSPLVRVHCLLWLGVPTTKQNSIHVLGEKSVYPSRADWLNGILRILEWIQLNCFLKNIGIDTL